MAFFEEKSSLFTIASFTKIALEGTLFSELYYKDPPLAPHERKCKYTDTYSLTHKPEVGQSKVSHLGLLEVKFTLLLKSETIENDLLSCADEFLSKKA